MHFSSQHVSSIFSLLQPQPVVTCKPDWRLQHRPREGRRAGGTTVVCRHMAPLHTDAGCHYCEGKGKQSSSHPATDLNHSQQHRGNRQLQSARLIIKQLSEGRKYMVRSWEEEPNCRCAAAETEQAQLIWYEYVDWTHNAVITWHQKTSSLQHWTTHTLLNFQQQHSHAGAHIQWYDPGLTQTNW